MPEPLDKGIIIGDVVTGFHPGFYEVVRIYRSWGRNGVAVIFQGEQQDDLEEVAVYFEVRKLVDENYNFVNESAIRLFSHKDVELVTKASLEEIKTSLFKKISESCDQVTPLLRK